MGDKPPFDQEDTQTIHGLSDHASQVEALQRGVSVGRYVILDAVGTGGMGIVYSAYDPELDRKVAIKLLQSNGVYPNLKSLGQARLMREARVLAQLSHPNVLPIFDLGRFGDQIFMAMEFVRGRTLKEWQIETTPSWRKILNYYISAGRGLAAAHKAGVVHRDFKPHNVMVGNDDQVRVMDFGLARYTAEQDTIKPESDSDPVIAGLPGEALTQTGSLMGSPAYMSPEQLALGEIGDATDQFSFAVALYEAFYGERPFNGSSPDELLKQINHGETASTSQLKSIPTWVRRVLLRALNNDPASRYQNMDDMLRALERDPTRVRNRWLAGITATLGVIAIASIGYNYQQPDMVCKGAREKLAGVWDGARKEKIEQAFLATGLPYANDSWNSIERLFDQYTDNWVASYTGACEATHVRGEQSETLLDLRMICLDGRKQEIKALTDLFADADANITARAAKAASAVSGLESCSDATALTALVPLPTEPESRLAVADIERELARASALRQIGQFQNSVELARLARDKANELNYLPVMAHANYRIGDALDYLGKGEEAEAIFRQSFVQSIAGGDDRQSAKTAAAQVWILGHILNRAEQSHLWTNYGRAFLQRLGGDPLIEADLLSNTGSVAQDQGDYPLALALAQQVLDLRQQVLGNNHERVATAMVNLANAKRNIGEEETDFASILALYEQAYKIFGANMGEDHPANAAILYNWGGALSENDQPEEAFKVLTRAVSLARRNYGDNNFETALALQNIAEVEFTLEQYEQSLHDYLTALPIIEAQLSEDHPFIVPSIAGIVGNLIAMNRFEEAELQIERGFSMIDNKDGQELPLSLFTFAQAKIALQRDGNTGRARALAKESLNHARLAGVRAIAQINVVQAFLDSL